MTSPIHEQSNNAVTTLLLARLADVKIEDRLEIASMCSMFSFWSEIQATLIAGSEEIKRLNKKIAELEHKRRNTR